MLAVAASRTIPASTNTWTFGITVTPSSAPKDWLVTLPNADWMTPSTYPWSVFDALAGVCALATPDSASIPIAIATNDRIVSVSSRKCPYLFLNLIAAWPVNDSELSFHGFRTTSVRSCTGLMAGRALAEAETAYPTSSPGFGTQLVNGSPNPLMAHRVRALAGLAG